MKKITDYLHELGLTEMEALIYEGLLETGPTTVKALSDHIGIKRITTHFNVENLINKGLITQSAQGARRQIIAESPDRLYYLIEQKEKSVKQLQIDFPDFVKTLQGALSKPNSEEQKVEVKYYEGENGVKLIYKDVLSAKKVRSYVKLDAVSSVLPENVTLFNKGFKENPDLVVWEIVEKSEVSKINTDIFSKNTRYHYKIAHSSIRLASADVMIYNNKIAMINLSKQVSGVIIKSKDFYDITKEIFDFVWRMTPYHTPESVSNIQHMV